MSGGPAPRCKLPDGDLDGRVAEARSKYSLEHPQSLLEHERASAVLPGGNTRTVLHFDPFPFRVMEADGPELIDIDGHRYLDFCGNYSAGLLGHSPATIRDAIVAALDRGWAFGATHTGEVEVAELICDRYKSVEQVRFTNSGTEANLMAIGTAMHHTGRTGVGVFDLAYHGGVLSFGEAGGSHHLLNVPHRFTVAPFDDADGLDRLFADTDLACVLIEVVQGSGGCRPVSPEFLDELRQRCTDKNVVLIFDEVMTSRLAPGGGQERFGVTPDMTTLGKYLGGGMTFGAFGGRRDIMATFDPQAGGALTQAGTFNNNVVSMAAAKATLQHELEPSRLAATNDRGDRLRHSLDQTFEDASVPLWVTGIGSMLAIHADDDRLLELLFHAALNDGFYLARRGFMALSMAITDEHTNALVQSIDHWSKGLRAS
ncbi:MAG: aminotransferase class III-fold pyridoxal phosphate-dependent enzyme [Acidimicrobiales bacterium]